MVDIQSISLGLELGDDGIWYGSDEENLSYPSGGNEYCFAVEDGSFWFRHRNECIASVVASFMPDRDGTIFDIGGGNGLVSLRLAEAGFDVALVEPGRLGATNANNRGLETVICATTRTARFKEGSLPAVGLFDVIEHIEEDIGFLQSMRGLMQKGDASTQRSLPTRFCGRRMMSWPGTSRGTPGMTCAAYSRLQGSELSFPRTSSGFSQFRFSC